MCPPLLVTGGPTWCHQLVYALNQSQYVDAKIYYNSSKTRLQAEVYTKKYNNPYIGIKDNFGKNDIVIFPEIYQREWDKDKYKDCIKFVFWESVNYYLCTAASEKLNDFSSNTYHIAQGQYAKEYLKFAQVPRTKIIHMTDCIEKTYFNLDPSILKTDYILYNPKKGLSFTQQIIKAAKDMNLNLNFIPIIGYSTEQVKALMEGSKVYMDFGYSPGKDRMPREAAISNCCIITSKLGSFKYYEDMPIFNKYKFDKTEENISLILNTLTDLCNNYETKIFDFQILRDSVIQEVEDFKKGVLELIEFCREKIEG